MQKQAGNPCGVQEIERHAPGLDCMNMWGPVEISPGSEKHEDSLGKGQA